MCLGLLPPRTTPPGAKRHNHHSRPESAQGRVIERGTNFSTHKIINPFTARTSRGKRPTKERNLKPFSLFVFCFPLPCVFIKMLSTQSRCVIGQGNILFAGFFQPLNFVGRGSERATFCRVLCAPVPLPPPPAPSPFKFFLRFKSYDFDECMC